MTTPTNVERLTLLPTDRVLLLACRRTALPPWPRRFDAAAVAAATVVGLVVALWLRRAHGASLDAVASGLLASGLMLAAWRGGRWAWSRSWPTLIDAERLLPLLVAEALLAQQDAGLLRLVPTPEGLRADPVPASMPWPADSLEAQLLRARPVAVARLVADWRDGRAASLEALARSAELRGVVGVLESSRGVGLAPTPAARAAAARQPAGLRIDDCKRRQPALWRDLMAAMAEASALAPTAEVPPRAKVDPSAPTGVDRFGLPTDQEPASALGRTLFIATFVVVAALTVARLSGALGPDSWLGWPAWPYILGTLAAVLAFAAARRTWPDEPLPRQGSPGEEDALALRRRRRLARPHTPPALPWRLLGAGTIGLLAFILTLFITPLGVLAVALSVGCYQWRLRHWYRLQQLMPSPREVELAVARRSRELSAGAPGPPWPQPAGERIAEVVPRRRHWLTAAELPPPSAGALARTDRRRQLAATAVRRYAAALLLYVGALATVVAGLALAGHTPLPLLALCGAAWLPFAAWAAVRLLDALHRTRATAWQHARGLAGPLLRALAALLPHAGAGRLARAGRALRRAVVEPPDFWRDEALNVDEPLGASPRVLAGVTAGLGLLLSAGGLWAARAPLVVAGMLWLAQTLAYAAWLRRSAVRAAVPAAPGIRLVLLRVFGSPSFDDLLDRVRPWLLCGPVAHLEGHDSVVRSAEVREALALDQIDAILVHSPDELSRRVAALPNLPDDNGRYCRQAFQCTDTIWRDAVRALLERGDRVLMDLSSLGPSDLGCAYELGLLLDRFPLSRVVLLVDDSTDLACLRKVLNAAERRIAPDSPNGAAAVAPPAWRLLHTGGGGLQRQDESRADWLRRLDGRLDPLALVHFVLDPCEHGD